MLQNTNTITINDNPITINQKLARIEANAIIENFLKDFGFDFIGIELDKDYYNFAKDRIYGQD